MMKNYVRIANFNPNLIRGANKRRITIKSSVGRTADPLRLSKTYLFGQGIAQSENGSECEYVGIFGTSGYVGIYGMCR